MLVRRLIPLCGHFRLVLPGKNVRIFLLSLLRQRDPLRKETDDLFINFCDILPGIIGNYHVGAIFPIRQRIAIDRVMSVI